MHTSGSRLAAAVYASSQLWLNLPLASAAQPLIFHPTRDFHANTAMQLASAQPAAVTMSWHGGPLMMGTPNIYIIWYGNWSGSATTTIIPDFLNHLGGSPYYNINTTYYSGSGIHRQYVTNALHYSGATIDNYSQGMSLSDGAILGIVSRATNPLSGSLPEDLNGIYLVLTSQDVGQSGALGTFGVEYCGWHKYALNRRGVGYIKYAFIGDASLLQNPGACIAQTFASPNANVGADGMVSVIAHEIEETVTDPQLNAWYATNGMENADLCAWTFGTKYYVPNGSQANMRLGTRDYLIQQNWLNDAAQCALAR